MKKYIFLIILAIIIINVGYTYYRTNLLPFQSLVLECKAEYIKYPNDGWDETNTTKDQWEHYNGAKKNYPIVKFPKNFKIKFNYKNSGKFIDANDFFKDRSFVYYTKTKFNDKHSHFMFDLPIPKNEWNETMGFSVEIKQPYLEKEPFPRKFMISYLSTGFFNDVDGFYYCEEIK